MLVEAGWQNGYRIYGTLLHIDLVDQKLWIQHDGTEDGVADELVAAGIPKSHIVLAFKLSGAENFLRSCFRFHLGELAS